MVFLIMAVYFAIGLSKDPSILPAALINKPIPEFSLPPIDGVADCVTYGTTAQALADYVSLVEALKTDSRIDVLLLDVMLPDGNGFDILAKMRRHPKLTLLPIIMLTAKDEAEDMKKGLALGADAYVTKPYSKNILVDTIRKVLRQPAPK